MPSQWSAVAAEENDAQNAEAEAQRKQSIVSLSYADWKKLAEICDDSDDDTIDAAAIAIPTRE